ncbi:hypothetical protein LCGC14_1882170 [marine sediment metagenome]|uniref:Phage ABA sandwich domain-containing protein n=1 Tax=marine sediment metagenome TaxID=412755 RepID=A0A0F9GQ82_9ZZZZ
MNTAKITRFLAEAIEWTPANKDEHLWGFDPMNDIAHAWMVVEWMLEKQVDIALDSGWECVFYGFNEEGNLEDLGTSEAKTAPEAICIAAVRALADEKQLGEMGIK